MNPNKALYLLTILYGVLLISLYFCALKREVSIGDSLAWQIKVSYDDLGGLFLVCVLGAMLGACSYLQSLTSLGISGVLMFLYLPAFVNLDNSISTIHALLYGWTSLYGFSDSVSLLLARKIGKRKNFPTFLKYLSISALVSSVTFSIAVFLGDFNVVSFSFPNFYFLLSSIIGIPLLSYMSYQGEIRLSHIAFSLNIASTVFALIYRLKTNLSFFALFLSPFLVFKLSSRLTIPSKEVENLDVFDLIKTSKQLAKKRLILSALFTVLTGCFNTFLFLISSIGFLGIALRDLSFCLLVSKLRREGSKEIRAARHLLNSGDIKNCILALFPWFIRLISKSLEVRPHELRSISDPQGEGIKRLIWAAINPSEATRTDAHRMLLVLEGFG